MHGTCIKMNEKLVVAILSLKFSKNKNKLKKCTNNFQYKGSVFVSAGLGGVSRSTGPPLLSPLGAVRCCRGSRC